MVSVQGPLEDHAPGLGYFGVKLRPDAREVTKCRSPPKPGLMTKFASELLMEMCPRVRARAVRGGVAELRRVSPESAAWCWRGGGVFVAAPP